MAEDSNKKIDRIIEAATREFAEKGYEKASTAHICESAGVSKGLLFHHFGTKKGLFLEVYERIISDYIGRISKLGFNDDETYFENIMRISDAKLMYYSEFPEAGTIVFEAAYRTPDEMKGEIKEILDKYYSMEQFFNDWVVKQKHKLRDGVDPMKAWEIIIAVVNLLERKIMNEINSCEETGGKYLSRLTNRAEEFLEYYEIILNGMAVQDEPTPKGGQASEHDDISKERDKAV